MKGPENTQQETVQPRLPEEQLVGVKEIVNKLTERGKEWLSKLRNKAIGKPRQVLEDLSVTPKEPVGFSSEAEKPPGENEIDASEPTGADQTMSAISNEDSGPKIEFDPYSELTLDDVWRKYRELNIPHTRGQGLGTEEKLIYPGYVHRAKEKLFGKKIIKGSTSTVYIDPENGRVTKLFNFNVPDVEAASNARQMEIYERNAGKHPFLTFNGEVPGGWQQEYYPNDGNLKDYLEQGGMLKPEELEGLINDYNELLKITGLAHGDIVKHPDEINDFARELMRQSLEDVEETGYLNYQQILVGKPDESGKRRLIILDWGGNSDPFPLAGSTNPEDNAYIDREKMRFEEGVRALNKGGGGR